MTTERTSEALSASALGTPRTMAEVIADGIARGDLPAPATLPLALPAPAVALPRVVAPDSLLYMLQYRRPAGSDTERDFIRRYLKPLGVERDKRGNLFKRIGESPVLWSAHTDTMHRQGGFQRIFLRKNGAEIALANDDHVSGCLGGDNTAGVWLLREMVLAGVPGLYVFHRAEERGRLGSQWLAKNTPALLAGIKAAIAFDRRYESSVITRQTGKRSCSDAFADSLIATLGMNHQRDPHGSYTDTASYTGLVGECTNVSAGFANEHTEHETQNVRYLLALRDKLVALDATALGALAFTRQPGEVEPTSSYSYADYYDSDWSSAWRERWEAGEKHRKARAYVWWWEDALRTRDGALLPARSAPASNKRTPHAWKGSAAQSARSFRTIRDEIESHGKHGQRLRNWSDTGWALDDDEGDSSYYSGRTISVADVLRRYPESVGAWLEDQAVTADELLTMVARHKLASRR